MASAGRKLALYRELVQDHRAGLGPRCGGTAMRGKDKALQSDMLARQTKPSANACGLRMLFLRSWDKGLVEKKQGSLFLLPFYLPLRRKHIHTDMCIIIHNRDRMPLYPGAHSLFLTNYKVSSPGRASMPPDSRISAEPPSRLPFW